jgi:iron complex transport system permease protein
MPRPILFTVLTILAAAGVATGLAVGSVELAPSRVAAALLGTGDAIASDIVWKLRLPRVVAAFACGGLLSLAGVMMQALLRNPLADPYVFGVSGGAALGVLLAMMFGLGTALQTGLGLAGALAVAAIVFGLGFVGGSRGPYRLLLIGVVTAAGLNAVLSLILLLAPQTAVKGMLYWLMGDLGYAEQPWAAAVVLVLLLCLSLPMARALNVLGLGRAKARSLGVAVTGFEAAVYGVAAVAVLTSVLVGGTIGFVGLMVPHLLRLLGLADHRLLLPAAAMVGGSFLVLIDTVARSAWAPLQLPVGVLTALLGVPVLLLLLGQRDGRAAR